MPQGREIIPMPNAHPMRAWMLRSISVGAVIWVGLAFGAVSASAAAPDAKLKLRMSAQRFVVHGDHVVARGPVVARVIRPDGTIEKVRKRVHLRVRPTHRCRILKLHLAPLFLNLLGLEVRTSTINLKIRGDRRRALGSLFCSLSRGIKLSKHRLARRTARSLNRKLDNRPLRLLAFKAPLRAQEPSELGGGAVAPAAIPPPSPDSCEVLDLLLGPLHLDLLGLIVDLYGERRRDPVRVHITADPNGGLLGSLLCPGIAGPP